jgi:hypothetical protein
MVLAKVLSFLAVGLSVTAVQGCTHRTFSTLEQQQQQESPNCDDVILPETSIEENARELTLGTTPHTRTVPLWHGSVDGFPQSIVTGDFNQDGKLDIALVVCSQVNTQWPHCAVQTLHGRGNGTFYRMTTLPQSCLRTYRDLRTGDFDGDGISDLAAFTGPHDLAVTLWNAKGDGLFPRPNEIKLGGFGLPNYDWYVPGMYYYSPAGFLAPGNFHGDSHWEFYMGIPSSSSDDFCIPAWNQRVIVGNLDEQQNHDAIMIEIYSNPDSLNISLNGSIGATSLDICELSSGWCGQPKWGVIASIDGDNHSDLVLLMNSFSCGYWFKTFHGNGDGTFGISRWSGATEASEGTCFDLDGDDMPEVATSNVGDLVDMQTGDFNGDGATDLLLAMQNDSYEVPKSEPWLSISLGDGLGHFHAPKSIELDSPVLAVGDFDGDQAADVVLSSGWEIFVVSGRELVEADVP